MAKDVILVFDIGKTNKKVMLFDRDLKIVSEKESKFDEIPDDDRFMGDDIERIEEWIFSTCKSYLADPDYSVKAINFTTYGATIMAIDGEGGRLTPVYNYLKPMPEGIVEPMYERYGGEDEFCRNTAASAMGMLQAGLQLLWLKHKKPEVFGKAGNFLHFPQFLSSRLTGVAATEYTSIGCHTTLWDFDNRKYHDWVKDEGIKLLDPVPVDQVYPARNLDSDTPVGVGIHDSSASLVPYFKFSDREFILISTGTWCISMNPFNDHPLTKEELAQRCLCYMSVQQKPVKSNQLFLGHIHDVNTKRLTDFFKVDEDAYKKVGADMDLVRKLKSEQGDGRVFLPGEIPEDYIDDAADLSKFANFDEAYHQLMIDLVDIAASAIQFIIAPDDSTEDIYITGGFSKNGLFTGLLGSYFPGKQVYTSEVANATSLGAALVLWKCFGIDEDPEIDLGLNKIESFTM